MRINVIMLDTWNGINCAGAAIIFNIKIFIWRVQILNCIYNLLLGILYSTNCSWPGGIFLIVFLLYSLSNLVPSKFYECSAYPRTH